MQLIALAKEKASPAIPETAPTRGTRYTSAISPPCSAWRWRGAPQAATGTRSRMGPSRFREDRRGHRQPSGPARREHPRRRVDDAGYFGLLANIVTQSYPASNLITRQTLGWEPDRPRPVRRSGQRPLLPRRQRTGTPMTTVGLIGSGNIGITVAQLAIDAGHHVVLSNSHGPETLADTVAELGPRAPARRRAAMLRRESVTSSWSRCRSRRSPTCPPHHWPARRSSTHATTAPNVTGASPELDSNALTSSELLLRYMPRAGLVKAFDEHLHRAPALARPPGGSGRPLVATDHRGLRAGEGGGDRLH